MTREAAIEADIRKQQWYLDKCADQPACAPLLQDGPVAGLTSDEQFRLLAYGVGMAFAWDDRPRSGGLLACVSESSEAVLAELKRRYPNFGCVSAALFWSTGARVSHNISIGKPINTAQGRRAEVSYHMGRGGAEWMCDFVFRSGSWRHQRCRGTGQY